MMSQVEPGVPEDTDSCAESSRLRQQSKSRSPFNPFPHPVRRGSPDLVLYGYGLAHVNRTGAGHIYGALDYRVSDGLGAFP